ncbi:PH domain-containing protein [Allorhizobium sp. BGMRC 0089]|uniref:PH domain-containing protein n=1 Tax=Allorhizobium sonneratiae TaxID=2934936 RepID=UPI0020335465|nr:PH domain-containing protein [Allorhizobium sonneratiae]MCM2291134.1 PH domain-containing protein [Allorhizobium sonneratiae]
MIKLELQPGETIRWAGKPKFGPVLRWGLGPIMISFIPIGITSREVFQLLERISIGKGPRVGESYNEIVTHVVACFFFFFGCYSIATAILKIIEMSQAAYAVTDRRVLIVSHLFHKRVRAFAPTSINTVEILQKSDGSGTVTFRRDVVSGDDGHVVVKLDLVGVDDVANVAREIERLRLSVQQSSSLR